MNSICNVHGNIKPIKALVREDVLYDMDAEKSNTYLPCTLIGVSSYPGHALTFQIVINNTSLFYYIPPHLLNLNNYETVFPVMGLNDLVYHNCPDSTFVISEINYLKDKELYIYIKSNDSWIQGSYLWSIDWYLGNDLLHAIKLTTTGQIALMPNHKISVEFREQKLPQFKKLKAEWKV